MPWHSCNLPSCPGPRPLHRKFKATLQMIIKPSDRIYFELIASKLYWQYNMTSIKYYIDLWACSFVASMLMLYAIRNFLTWTFWYKETTQETGQNMIFHPGDSSTPGWYKGCRTTINWAFMIYLWNISKNLFFTPVTVPPQVGTKVAGPKSGAHFSSFNWDQIFSCERYQITIRGSAKLYLRAGFYFQTFSSNPSYSPALIWGIVFLQ